MANPTLYDNFTRVKDWAVEKFADKEQLAYQLSDVAFSGDYADLLNTPNLSSYVTKTDLNNAGYLTAVPNDYPTYAAISAMGYLTAVPNTYPTYTAIQAMGYATQAYVTNAIDAIPGVDLTGYATETYVMTAIGNVINSAPAALDTLEELAAALGDDPNFATTIATQMGNKADKADVYTKAEIQNMSYVSTTALNTRLNNAGYISSIPSEYVTDAELSACGYLTAVPNTYPTYAAISAMGYITSIPSEYITESELSSAGYITSIPSEYITESELSACAYVTALSQAQMDVLFPIS